MASSFGETLDLCLDRVMAGEDIESVLALYPDDAARLRPLIRASIQARQAYAFAPDAGAKQAAGQRFTAALVARREAKRLNHPGFWKALARPAAWGAIATAAVAVAVGLIAVRPALAPMFTSSQEVLPITPSPDAAGNFVFLVSDDINAIADFDSVVVGIKSVGLQRSEDGRWIEFLPESPEVDLTLVPGDAVAEIWRGNIPAGDFRQVVLHVDNVTGILRSSGRQVEIKLPSSKLHLAIPFAVADNTVTTFTYDMTVFATGQERNTKYILKPQEHESGADQRERNGGNESGDPEPGSNPGNGKDGDTPARVTGDRNVPTRRPASR